MAGFMGWGAVFSPLGVAEIVSGAAGSPPPEFPLWSHLIRVVAILSAMVGALLLTLALWKRFAPRTHRGPALIQVLATHYLAPKHTLMVVAVGRERFLVASSPNQLKLMPLAEGEHGVGASGAGALPPDQAEKG
jgi:hypothetical protein